jgi:hypothetical protein
MISPNRAAGISLVKWLATVPLAFHFPNQSETTNESNRSLTSFDKVLRFPLLDYMGKRQL